MNKYKIHVNHTMPAFIMNIQYDRHRKYIYMPQNSSYVHIGQACLVYLLILTDYYTIYIHTTNHRLTCKEPTIGYVPYNLQKEPCIDYVKRFLTDVYGG